MLRTHRQGGPENGEEREQTAHTARRARTVPQDNDGGLAPPHAGGYRPSMPADLPSLRPATEADLPALAALYDAAVRALGAAAYSPAQVDAWAGRGAAPETLRPVVLGAYTLVAEDATGPIGFAGLADDGLVTMLYVRPDRMRRGVGGRLLGAILTEARRRGLPRLYTAASVFSRPVFERFGFRLDEVETVVLGGVPFERDRMSLPLDLPGEGTRPDR